MCVTWYLWNTGFSTEGSEDWNRKRGDCVHTTFLTRESTGIARHLWIRVWLVWFPCACLLFPSGNLFVGGIWAFSTFVQVLWMFSSSGRDTAVWRFQICSCYIFRTDTECICSKSDVFWAVSQTTPVEPIWVFSVIPTWTRSAEVFYNKHVVFTVCEILQSMTAKPCCRELWDCNMQEWKRMETKLWYQYVQWLWPKHETCHLL